MYCDDGLQAEFPPSGPPPAKAERGAPWRPPDFRGSTCTRCGRLSWQHRSHPQALADEIDRAIYAAAFVAAMQREGMPEDPASRVATAIQSAEVLVEQHRRARSGT